MKNENFKKSLKYFVLTILSGILAIACYYGEEKIYDRFFFIPKPGLFFKIASEATVGGLYFLTFALLVLTIYFAISCISSLRDFKKEKN